LLFLQVVCDLGPLCRLLSAKGGQRPSRALKSREGTGGVGVPWTRPWDQKDPSTLEIAAVANWRKCDIDPAGMDTLKVTTDI
jgi:hypothetical protein